MSKTEPKKPVIPPNKSSYSLGSRKISRSLKNCVVNLTVDPTSAHTRIQVGGIRVALSLKLGENVKV